MKRIIFLIVVFIWLTCTANQCSKEKCHNKIPFINNSDKTLYVFPKTSPPFDTILGLGSGFFIDHDRGDYKVLPNSVSTTAIFMRSRNCFNGFQTIMIFVLNEWADIILRRYDLTPEDLELLNWEVPYPPTEVMKNMKMWPPYGNE